MIDTVDVFYSFPSLDEYDACYSTVDALARSAQCPQALHRDGRHNFYITTAFASMGILQIRFGKEHYRRACYLFLHPIRTIHPNSHVDLTHITDTSEIFERLNSFIAVINRKAGKDLLPSIQDWNVKRIDYAVDIWTPYVREYVRLFYAGSVPFGFTRHEYYESSFYLHSDNCKINFYDKLEQVRQVYNMTDEDIKRELSCISPGILRLEVQLRNHYIHYMKEKYNLVDTTLLYLWNMAIAINELLLRIKSIIGTQDFFPYEICAQRLRDTYHSRTASLCSQLIKVIKDCSPYSLDNVKEILPTNRRNMFEQHIHKIRKANMNPIPLERADSAENLSTLANPCQLVINQVIE